MSQKLRNVGLGDLDPTKAILRRNEIITYYLHRLCTLTKIKSAQELGNALSRKAHRACWRNKLENADQKHYNTTISNVIGSKTKLLLPDNFDSNVANDMNKFFANTRRIERQN